MAMIAITTSSSMSVNPPNAWGQAGEGGLARRTFGMADRA
jgi:hypothetical protein